MTHGWHLCDRFFPSLSLQQSKLKKGFSIKPLNLSCHPILSGTGSSYKGPARFGWRWRRMDDDATDSVNVNNPIPSPSAEVIRDPMTKEDIFVGTDAGYTWAWSDVTTMLDTQKSCEELQCKTQPHHAWTASYQYVLALSQKTMDKAIYCILCPSSTTTKPLAPNSL